MITLDTDFLNLQSKNFKDIDNINEFTDSEKDVLTLISSYFNKSIYDIESIDYDDETTFWIEYNDFGSIIRFEEEDKNNESVSYNIYNKRLGGNLIGSFKMKHSRIVD